MLAAPVGKKPSAFIFNPNHLCLWTQQAIMQPEPGAVTAEASVSAAVPMEADEEPSTSEPQWTKGNKKFMLLAFEQVMGTARDILHVMHMARARKQYAGQAALTSIRHLEVFFLCIRRPWKPCGGERCP